MFNWPGRRVYPHYGDCYAQESITVGSSVVGFSASLYQPPGEKPAGIAMVTVEGGQARFREDGDDPTTTSGHLVGDGDVVIFRSLANIQRARFVAVAESPVIQVSYYR